MKCTSGEITIASIFIAGRELGSCQAIVDKRERGGTKRGSFIPSSVDILLMPTQLYHSCYSRKWHANTRVIACASNPWISQLLVPNGTEVLFYIINAAGLGRGKHTDDGIESACKSFKCVQYCNICSLNNSKEASRSHVFTTRLCV